MITREELDILQTPDAVRLIEENIERDPLKIAMDKRIPHAALIATQVKYLQRARKKLPSYYAARCIIPSLSFEQSSSELTAKSKNYNGKLCIDLTCGLGVDSLYLSHRFDKVVSIERDAILAEIARINFAKLGRGNITVVNQSAEEFVAAYKTNAKADLIYADPDRRGADGKKQVCLEDCSPNMPTLMPALKAMSDMVVIKNSPLFDVDEAFRIFGDQCLTEVISVGGECKEVVIELGHHIVAPTIKATAIGIGSFTTPYSKAKGEATTHSTDSDNNKAQPSSQGNDFSYKYLIIPDVALRKARITAEYFRQTMPAALVTSNDGYIFANETVKDIASNDAGRIEALNATGDSSTYSADTNTANAAQTILGRVFEVIEMQPYAPEQLKKRMKQEGVKGIDIYLGTCNKTAQQISRELGVREGGSKKIAFTTICGQLWSIEIK